VLVNVTGAGQGELYHVLTSSTDLRVSPDQMPLLTSVPRGPADLLAYSATSSYKADPKNLSRAALDVEADRPLDIELCQIDDLVEREAGRRVALEIEPRDQRFRRALR